MIIIPQCEKSRIKGRKNRGKRGVIIGEQFIRQMFKNITINIPEDFDKIIDAMYDLKLDHIELNMLTPFPGTPLFERLDREGRILTKNWFHYREGQSGTNVTFQPKNMTPEELAIEGRHRIFENWYGGGMVDAKKYRMRKLGFVKEGLKFGFYPFIYRAFGYFFHL